MTSSTRSPLVRCAVALALLATACPGHGRPLAIAANTATNSYDPVTGIIYLELRNRLRSDFPGTTFTSLPLLTGDLSGFDLIILNRFSSQELLAAEQAAIVNYVVHGGNLLYVGDAIGALSNATFTLPFGISMTPDPSTDGDLTLATYTNLVHPFLNGPFGVPLERPSGSYAAQVSTPGPSVELARWDGGGVAISAFERNRLAPGAGFGLFLTDVNMVTPGRYSQEVRPVLSNALSNEVIVKPVLGIAPVTGGVRLTWDAPAIGWTLQVSDGLASWSDIGTAITGAGSYTGRSGHSKRFFRLRR